MLTAFYYVVRQKLNRIYDAKVEMVMVYAAFLVGMVLELSRDFTTNPAVITAYTFGEVGLILLIVTLLTGISYTYYLRPSEPTFAQRVGSLFRGKRLPYGVALVLVGAYFLFIEGYLLAARPFAVIEVPLGAWTIAAPRFNQEYVALLYGVLLFYLLVPLRLFILKVWKTNDIELRRSLLVLPLSWTAVGSVLLLFNGVLLELNLNLLVFGHMLLALIFGVTALTFRNVSLLGHMLDPIDYAIPVTVPVFTGPLGVDPASISGGATLLEVDPSSSYESVVEDFLIEQQSRSSLVYVFTSATSPVMTAVSRLPGVRFFVLTDAVSYALPTREPHRTLAPQNDPDALVDLVGQIPSANRGGGVSVVFDSISPMVLAFGEQGSLRLVRRMVETLSKGGVTSLFLMTRGAHRQELVASMRGLFALRLSYDSSGLREVGTSRGPVGSYVPAVPRPKMLAMESGKKA